MNRTSLVRRVARVFAAPKALSEPSLRHISVRHRVIEGLERADVHVNAATPRAWDINVSDDRFFRAVARDGSLGFGESYVEGWWDCEAPDELFARLCLVPKPRTRSVEKTLLKLGARAFNLQSKARAHHVVQAHYNLSNEMFSMFLDSRMQYSCAYWEGASNLEEAQIAKLDLICQKLKLSPGMRVLEIGCGWGGLAEHMARHYGVRVSAVNISEEQLRVARERCGGLNVEFLEMDYREVAGEYDRVVSIAMFEAVGAKNYADFMGVVHRCLRDDGVFLLHTIGENIDRTTADPWIVKYIFPNGQVPSLDRIAKSMERRFVIEDVHNIGAHYDPTLMAWAKNFEARWPEIRALGFDERFRRMWLYYLYNCAGAFRGRSLQLWQVVATKLRSGTPYRRIACV